MKNLLILLLFIAFQGNAQELIIQSQNAESVFNPQTFNTESTKLNVVLYDSYIKWNDDAPDVFIFQAKLETESGFEIVDRWMIGDTLVLDTSTDIHDYIRNRVYAGVIAKNPYGVPNGEWIKQY